MSDWVGAQILSNWGEYKKVAGEHLAIFESLSVGEAEKAAAAMERHLNGTESRFLERLAAKGLDE